LEPTSDSYGRTRRAFHLAVIYAFGAVVSFLVAIPTVLYLLVPGRQRKASNFIDAGDVSQLAPALQSR